MGGCRCTFRECENGTASKRELHYFRFPVRDPVRLKIWAKHANRMEFLDLPKDKLANKVVCQEHFERCMFMNLLCDRLTRSAIPRLMPQEDSSVLNVETGNVHWNYTDDDMEDSRKKPAVSLYPPQTPKSQITVENLRVDDWPEPVPETSAKKIKILNSETFILNSSDPLQNVVRIKSARSRGNRFRDVDQPETSPDERVQNASPTDGETHTLVEIQEDSNIEEAEGQNGETTTLNMECETTAATDRWAGARNSSKITPMPPKPRFHPVPVIDPILQKKLQHNNNEIADLKKMVNELLSRSQAVCKPQTISPKVVMERGPQLTKAQLFSGIKRYLNPTMVTLLRMELFSGSTDRPWKPDEKSLAVDLLNIGEPVYDHLTEEFRFRLPPKEDAREWKEAGEMEADDAC